MPKKHKLHRHKDKHSSKTRTHRKLKKQVSQTQLEPIQEVSKERLRYDKNACGDFVRSSILRTQLENDKAKKSKVSKNIKVEVDKINVKSQEKPLKEKAVRHHSLEKNENSLLNKTRFLFRKEKSFNDAIQKTVNLKDGKTETSATKKERKHKHRHKGTKFNKSQIEGAKEVTAELINGNNPNQIITEISQIPKKKTDKSHKKRHRSNDTSPQFEKPALSRVQEVIFCQTKQVPYKMKNDKSGSEIKDLYRRLKRESRRVQNKDETVNQRSGSRGGNKLQYSIMPEKHVESYLVRTEHQPSNDNEKQLKERFKELDVRKYDEFEMNRLDFGRKEKYQKEEPTKKHDKNVLPKHKHARKDLSEISLGPYEKYFAFESQHRNKHCKNHPRKEHTAKSTEKKHGNDLQENYRLEYEEQQSRKQCGEKEETKKEPTKVEEKIHQIVEGDLKNYFHKIQAMIDKKLDAILQVNKSKHDERKKDKAQRESRKRSCSKTKKTPEENADNKRDVEEHKKKKPSTSSEKKDENVNKEEIINEVLKRLRGEERQKFEHEEKERKLHSKASEISVSKPKKVNKENYNKKELVDKPHTYKESNKMSNSDALISKNMNISWKSSESNRLHGHSHRSTERQHISDKVGRQRSVKSYKQQDLIASKEYRHDGSLGQSGKNKFVQPLSDKLERAKNSLDYIRQRSKPPLEIAIPSSDKCNLDYRVLKKQQKRRADDLIPSIMKPYESTSSYKTYTDQRISGSVISQMKDEIVSRRRYRHMYSASDETIRTNYYGQRRRSSSPERCSQRIDLDCQQRSMAHRQRGLIRERENTVFLQNVCQKYLRCSPPRCSSKHDVSTQEPFLQEIFLPPDNFRCPTEAVCKEQKIQKTKKCLSPHQFIVQGIEPPILECPTRTPRRNTHGRILECKTVSIIGIPPQIDVKELPVMNQTQTSSKSRKSSATDRDLVEKKKKSKRFQLYYKYSVIDTQEHNGESSDAKSIVSDSYRIISDPSEECIINKEYKKERRMTSEASQAIHIVPNKWNRISTPRESRLNNIIEEPSNGSISLREQDYFVPLRGTKEFYCRVLSSSHSDYCLKIDKKPANSNISFQSKDTWDGRYVLYEDKKCRYYRSDLRSRSDFKLISKQDGNYLPRSKSDLFLDGNRGKHIIKSIFLADNNSFVKNKNVRKLAVDLNIDKPKKTFCKDCQTTNMQEEVDNALADDTLKVIKHKQKQFAEIYKTIDNLEKNIHSSRHVPPKTVDVAVSSSFFNVDDVGNKKTEFVKVSEAVDHIKEVVTQTSKDLPVEKVDAAIGSPVSSRQTQRVTRIGTAKQIHDVAVGNSEVKFLVKPKTPRSNSRKGPTKDTKHLKSTAVSPIRITEEAVTPISTKNAAKKIINPPKTKQFVARAAVQKLSRNTPESSPFRAPVFKPAESKKEQLPGSSPITQDTKDTKPKSANKPRLLSNECQQKTSKHLDTPPKPTQNIKVFRSAEKNSNVKKLVSNTHNSGAPGEVKQSTNKEEIDLHSNVKEDDSNKKCGSKTARNESCFLHILPKKSETPTTGKSTTAPSNVNSIIVNRAYNYNCQSSAQSKVEKTESSTSSSVSDAPQIMRRSKSLVELGSHKGGLSKSKSDICCLQQAIIVRKGDYLEAKEGSNNMEKFINEPNLRCVGSQSHGTSLDHYIRNKFISRLFLTKDYKGEAISAYQKRKLYDQSIRQKMKKKFKFSKVDVGPQIFEVRFLSMVSEEENQHKENDYRFSKKPVLSVNLGKIEEKGIYRRCYSKPNSSVNVAKAFNKPLENTDNLNLKERDHIVAANNNEAEMNCSLTVDLQKPVVESTPGNNRDMHQEKLIHFVKKIIDTNSKFNEDILKYTECACNKLSRDCSACKNFIGLMARINTSLVKCDSKGSSGLYVNNSSELEVYLKKKESEPKYQLDLSLPRKCHKENLNVEEIFPASRNRISTDSTQSTEPSGHNFDNPVECLSSGMVEEANSPVLLQPMSCPILTMNSSSFDFLYEEAISLDNDIISRDTAFANLTRPFDQTFNFSTSQYNVETPYFRENCKSTSDSIESGYASIKSKSCCVNSFTNFFKKPNIAALFKPPILTTKKDSKAGESPEKLAKNIVYKEMMKKCQLYARKVKQRSEMKLEENIDEYQEFSLKLLLGKDSSVVLESKTLSVRTIESSLENTVQHIHSREGVGEVENNPLDIEEHLIELSNKDSSEEDFTKAGKISYAQNGCKLILNNQYLNIEHVTYLGPEMFSSDFNSLNAKTNVDFAGLHGHESSFTLDFSLDSNNPFVASNDSVTHKFLTSLIKTYERETDICERLYNDRLFESLLLDAVKEQRREKTTCKKRGFCKLFKKKMPLSQKHVDRDDFQNHINADLQKDISTRLQSLASNARKCFTMLAEAVKINENIDKEIKICGLLRLLERIEKGDFRTTQNDEHEDIEEELRNQVKDAFVKICVLCQKESKKYKQPFTHDEIELIKSFVTRYRIGLVSEINTVVSYISRGIIQTENQLKAAVTFFMRSRSHEVNIKEFEEYCKFRQNR